MTNHPNRSKTDAAAYPFGDKYLLTAKYPARRLATNFAMQRMNLAKRQAKEAAEVHEAAVDAGDTRLANVAWTALQLANRVVEMSGWDEACALQAYPKTRRRCMITQAALDAAAKALFRNICGDNIKDDPTFPDRIWAQMDSAARAPYYRVADVALTAAESAA